MSYTLLGKLYYGDPSDYKKEYERRFSSEETIKLNFKVSGMQAFFLENRDVLKLAYGIRKTDKEVTHLSLQLPGVARRQYSQKCLIDEIVITNKIEGVHSSRKEIGEALDILQDQAQKRRRHVRFQSLVRKYLKLITNETISLSNCRNIRDIYDELFLDEVVAESKESQPDGELFRKGQTTVYSNTGKAIHNGLSPESQIINAMNQALFFLQDESVDSLYRICLFHYLIEYIHPFYDGNGRLGRFILSYCISKELEPLLAYRISETIKENINKYYKAFDTCNDPHNLGDLTPFLIMQLQMIDIALRDLKDSLTEKMILWDRYKALIPYLPKAKDNSNIQSLYHLLIQASLFSEKGISTAELRAQFEISYNTLQKMIQKIPADYIDSCIKGRTKYYQTNLKKLDEILLTENPATVTEETP